MNRLSPERIEAVLAELEIKLRCPTCNRKVRPATLMVCATIGARRTCSNGHAWRVTIRPVDVTAARALHEVTWCPLTEAGTGGDDGLAAIASREPTVAGLLAAIADPGFVPARSAS